jgi:hypothetical protein
LDKARERLIRHYWRCHAAKWPQGAKFFYIPIHKMVEPEEAIPSAARPVEGACLTFEYQQGLRQGRPAHRIVCEGLEVSFGYRDNR